MSQQEFVPEEISVQEFNRLARQSSHSKTNRGQREKDRLFQIDAIKNGRPEGSSWIMGRMPIEDPKVDGKQNPFTSRQRDISKANKSHAVQARQMHGGVKGLLPGFTAMCRTTDTEYLLYMQLTDAKAALHAYQEMYGNVR